MPKAENRKKGKMFLISDFNFIWEWHTTVSGMHSATTRYILKLWFLFFSNRYRVTCSLTGIGHYRMLCAVSSFPILLIISRNKSFCSLFKEMKVLTHL